MPNLCKICHSAKRATLEAAVASGQPVTIAAASLGLPYESAKRHFRAHVRRVVSSDHAATTFPEMTPVETFRAAFGMDPMEHQVKYLTDERSTVVQKARQIGMTQAAAALSIHVAMRRAGNDVVIISPSQRQSSEVTVRARVGLYELGAKLPQDSAGVLRLQNGSRILSLPGSARGIRGYAPALVILDEAAWISDETYGASRPLVAASGGRLVVQSTPGLPSGWFYELATNPPPGWLYMKVRADEVPTITPEFLAKERAELTTDLYAAEYEAEFQASGGLGALWSADDWLALRRAPEEEG